MARHLMSDVTRSNVEGGGHNVSEDIIANFRRDVETRYS